MNCLGRSGKGLTTYMNIRNRRRPNNKYKARTANTEVFPKDCMKIFDEFKDITSIRYRKRKVKNNSTEDYLFLAKTNY